MKKLFCTILSVLILCSSVSVVFAEYNSIDLTNMSDDELLALQNKLQHLLVEIADEIDMRAANALSTKPKPELPEVGYVDLILQAYEGIYESYSQSIGKCDDNSYFVLEDGYIYEYDFLFERSGKAKYRVHDLVPCADTSTIYTDREAYADILADQWVSVYSFGAIFKTDEDGHQFIQLKVWDEVNRNWKTPSAYDIFYKVDDTTHDALDRRYSKSVGIPTPEIGMTAEEVRNSTWGSPRDTNKTTYEWGTKEQWVYSGYRYIYFENGIVTAIQE